MALEFAVKRLKMVLLCLTSLDTAEAILRVIESMNFSAEAMEQPLATKEAVHS